MKITDITQQVRDKARFSVFVDRKYAFSLSDSQIRQSGLAIGQELSKDDLVHWKTESQEGKALDRTLRGLAIRARSQWELADYLKRKGVHPDLAAKITEQIKAFGYLDDRAFAESWVQNRRLLKSVSKRRLRQELLQKHVDADIIETVLAQDETSDQQVLDELIEKKSRQSRYHDEAKLLAYLARQGFSYGDIKDALARRRSGGQ